MLPAILEHKMPPTSTNNIFCQSPPSPDRNLGASARDLLTHLGLPLLHPLCDGSSSSQSQQVQRRRASSNANENDGAEEAEEDDFSSDGGGVFELPGVTFGRGARLDPSQQPPPPVIGPVSLLELHSYSLPQLLLTATTASAPTLAMTELWLRFFSVMICPLCACWMLHREISGRSCRSSSVTAKHAHASIRSKSEENQGNAAPKKEDNLAIGIVLVGLASAVVLATDSLYVYEYGRHFGGTLFGLMSLLALRCASSMKEDSTIDNKKLKEEKKKNYGAGRIMEHMAIHKRFLFQWTIYFFIGFTSILYLRSDGGRAMETMLQHKIGLSTKNTKSTVTNNSALDAQSNNSNNNPIDQMPHPGIDIPTIEPGLFYSSSNHHVSSIVSHWDPSSRTYDVASGATPYLVTGDQRTGIPFVVNKVEDQEYVRVWTQNRYDGEYLALDIAFPTNGNDHKEREFVHNLTMPVYLVLHGLNGGSHEEYVKDLVQRRRSEGSTVIVMIARGMMDTAMVGWNVFHGARTGDVDIAAQTVRRGLASLARAKDVKDHQILAGVGYSMGAIILSNYIARSGTYCALDAAMAISGGLDMRQQLNFKRSMRLWQPMLTFNLRDDILLGKYARFYKHRLTDDQFLKLLRVTSISALDVEAIVTYNSFDSLYHYYSEMSAMGDRPPEFQLLASESSDEGATNGGGEEWGRIANVSVPFVVLQALDDPLVGWRTIGTNNPQGLAEAGNGNLMLLLTKAGGHVGWPLGNNPKASAWKWMNDAARDFFLAVDMAIRVQ